MFAFLGGQLKEETWNHSWYVEQGKKDLVHVVGLINDHLISSVPYMLGEHLTIADIPVGLVVNRWFMINELNRPDYPVVAAYYELLTERPAYRKHVRNGFP